MESVSAGSGDDVGGTGGDSSTNTGGGSWSDENSNTLWGWLSNILNWLKSIAEGIGNIAGNIISGLGDILNTVKDDIILTFTNILNGFVGFFESIIEILGTIKEDIVQTFNSIVDGFSNMVESIKGLPALIKDVLVDVFIPDMEKIEAEANETVDKISYLSGLEIYDFSNLVDGEEKPADVKRDYSLYGIGTLNMTFADMSFLVRGVDYFRPLLQGLLVLWLIYYHINQFLAFIGHDNGDKGRVSAGVSDDPVLGKGNK